MNNSNVTSRLILAYSNNNFRGPGIVAHNLVTGLSKIGFPWLNIVTGETNNEEAFLANDKITKLGVLQQASIPREASIDLLGPNTFVMPREARGIISQSKALVVPSNWCKEKYLHYDGDIIGDRPIHVWPAGVDTDLYQPKENKEIPAEISELKVLVYYKNRTAEDFAETITLLSNFGIKQENITVLRYGSFTHTELLYACNKSHCAVLLGHTESQGLATLEILSMNLPILVFDQKSWVYLDDVSIVWNNATSVPYFDGQCGKIVTNFVGENYKEFFDKVISNEYTPREYIKANFSLEDSARKYLEIIFSID